MKGYIARVSKAVSCFVKGVAALGVSRSEVEFPVAVVAVAAEATAEVWVGPGVLAAWARMIQTLPVRGGRRKSHDLFAVRARQFAV